MILLPTMVTLPLIGKIAGVDYDVIADNSSNIMRGIVPSVGLSLIWAVVMARRAGWLRPIFAKQTASAMPKFLWLIPVSWFCLCLIRLVSTPWPSFDVTYLGVLALAMIMVGFNEEILFRGILTYGARGPGPWSETRTMLVSALGFGLFHLPNLFVGQALEPTLIQVAYAFLMGLALSISMRLSRTILLPIAMHAMWDFAVFTSKGQEIGTTLSLLSFGLLVIIMLLLIAAVVWCLGKKTRLVQP
jgi:uncharacterized protein